LIDPSGPTPTIGQQNIKLVSMPIQRQMDFFDKAGWWHLLVVLIPILYGTIQTYRGAELTNWFWWLSAATVFWAMFVRRPPYIRLSAAGISFPESKSPEYAWETMAEARAHGDELSIVLSDEQQLKIVFNKMRQSDAKRVKRLIRAQFEAMAERCKAAEDEAERLDELAA
jgi:hypothetical protein